jgi:hypothetical protein
VTALIPPIPEASDPSAAAGLAKHLAATAHYRNALIAASPDPAAPIAVAHRNASLAAVHFLRTLIYVTQHPDALRRETADQASREVLAAWLHGEAGEWTWTHCTALGLDPDAIAATVRAEDPLRGPERALGGSDGAAAAQEAPEALAAELERLRRLVAEVRKLAESWTLPDAAWCGDAILAVIGNKPAENAS